MEENQLQTSASGLRRAMEVFHPNDSHEVTPIIPASTEDEAVIKFGFLIEMTHPNILGAVSLAVDEVNNDSSLLPNVRLEFLFERIHSKRV